MQFIDSTNKIYGTTQHIRHSYFQLKVYGDKQGREWKKENDKARLGVGGANETKSYQSGGYRQVEESGCMIIKIVSFTGCDDINLRLTVFQFQSSSP